MVLVGRIGEHLEQLGVPTGAATVLGRTRPSTVETGRHMGLLRLTDRLDDDAVRPAVTEVVVPLELGALTGNLLECDPLVGDRGRRELATRLQRGSRSIT